MNRKEIVFFYILLDGGSGRGGQCAGSRGVGKAELNVVLLSKLRW